MKVDYLSEFGFRLSDYGEYGSGAGEGRGRRRRARPQRGRGARAGAGRGPPSASRAAGPPDPGRVYK